MKINGKRVFITGASSGIGKACAELFAQQGCHLLLCARRQQRLDEMAQQLTSQHGIEVHTFVLDVRDAQAVAQQIQSLPEPWQQIDILVNNAGLALGLEHMKDADTAHWEQMIDTNVKGLACVTQQVLPGMLQRNQGHIINIGSISSHEVYAGGVMYCATKFAVKAISDGLKKEVHGSQIRVSSVDPGMVKTEFSAVRFSGDEQRAEQVYEGVKPLYAEDIADAVLYCATRPQHVDVREIKIYPTAQTAAHMLSREQQEV